MTPPARSRMTRWRSKPRRIYSRASGSALPRMRAAVDAPLAAIREGVMPAFDELERMRHIDTAEGAVARLPRLPRRHRQAIHPAGHHRRAVRLRGRRAPASTGRRSTAAATSTRWCRCRMPSTAGSFARAGCSSSASGTFQEFHVACRHIDPGCRVTDNRDMTVGVQTTMRANVRACRLVGCVAQGGRRADRLRGGGPVRVRGRWRRLRPGAVPREWVVIG